MIETIQHLNFAPFLLSFELAFVTTFILFFLSIPFAWWLAQTKTKFKPFLEALTALPIVLPPSVLGFYILIFLAQDSFIGHFFQEYFGLSLVFNFSSLVIASCFYSLPFMVQPLQNGFEHLEKNMLEASYIAGKSQLTTLFRVALPNIKPAILSAIIITFAHTVGEFGVVLMVGGSIPGETKVASVAIYEMVEMMDYDGAYVYSAIMVFISFITLLGVYLFNGKKG
ncbi:Molybdenum transport system permease protein ModB (TC 3.A.1.8.1) [hydrothermal vent metagenome]|uniref:Molybdenum transport system permease protein ModB (TC 3.A.1.8.1) n=1 Tax=hydrothermal vent metagenome TaxID=652676 RepID=A0A1W1D464_9ZZZZ